MQIVWHEQGAPSIGSPPTQHVYTAAAAASELVSCRGDPSFSSMASSSACQTPNATSHTRKTILTRPSQSGDGEVQSRDAEVQSRGYLEGRVVSHLPWMATRRAAEQTADTPTPAQSSIRPIRGEGCCVRVEGQHSSSHMRRRGRGQHV